MRKLIVLACALALSGCASIVSKSDWPVTVTSSSPGVDFQVRNENGVLVCGGKTPQTVTLAAGDGYFDGMDYTVDSGGYTTSLTSRLNGWYIGNLVFGGVIGLLIVDPATGAMWKLPPVVQVAEPQRPAAAAVVE